MTGDETWDAVVVGGGPGGAAAARTLAVAGRTVLLVDDPRRRGGAGGNRRTLGEALPGGARPLLRELGVLAAVEAGPHLPSHGVVAAWGREEPAPASDAVRSPHGAGWHLDRRRFDADLRAAAGAAGAEVREGRVREVRPIDSKGGSGGCRRIATTDGETFEARWVVDATGRAATVSRAAGAARTRDDGLVALAAWYRTAGGGGERRTLIEAVPDGWWYTAPLPAEGPGGERVAVLHLDDATAAAALRRPGAWEERLAETAWIGRALRDDGDPRRLDPAWDPPRGAEASGARLDRVAGDGWIAVGDAALSFDPVSSQGMLDALYTGLAAGRAVDAALSGDPAPLAAYPGRLERIRRAYLDHHRHAYRAEGRWPDRPFWRARQAS